MKNKQKGFIIPAMIAIVLILTIGGGGYVYMESKKVARVEVENKKIEVVSTSTDVIDNTPSASQVNSVASTSSEIQAKNDIIVIQPVSPSASVSQPKKILIASDIKLETTTASTSVLKCSDRKCFISAITSCSQAASYQSKNENEFLGSLIKAEMLFNVYPSKNKCMLDFKLISYNISPTQDLITFIGDAKALGDNSPDILYPKLNKYAQDNTVGKSSTCNFTGKNKEIVEIFENKPTPSSELKIFKYINEVIFILIPDEVLCSGQLTEAIKKQGKMY